MRNPDGLSWLGHLFSGVIPARQPELEGHFQGGTFTHKPGAWAGKAGGDTGCWLGVHLGLVNTPPARGLSLGLTPGFPEGASPGRAF